MADRYWIAGSSANYNDTANWSTSSGGSGGASVPGSGDVAIFDSNGTGTCVLNVADAIYAATINTDITWETNVGSGQESQDNLFTLTVNTGNTLTVNGDLYLVTPASNTTWTINGAIDADPSWRSLSVVITSGSNNVTITGTGSIGQRLLSNVAEAASATITINGLTFNSFWYDTWSGRGQRIVLGADTVTVNDDIQLDSDGDIIDIDFDTNNGSLVFKADLIINGSNINVASGNGAITADGTAATQSVNVGGANIGNLVIDKSSGSVQLTGNATVKDLTCTEGTLDVNAQSLIVTGDMTVAAGFTVTE